MGWWLPQGSCERTIWRAGTDGDDLHTESSHRPGSGVKSAEEGGGSPAGMLLHPGFGARRTGSGAVLGADDRRSPSTSTA